MVNADDSTSVIQLPEVPGGLKANSVAGWVEPVSIDTYLPISPDPLPAFLDRRVYQGSSGRVFPLPFFESISQEKRPHLWQAVHLENEYVRVMMLPELGGRVHIAYDKVADYDFVYRNNVVKPALVGLTGPWISGGIEFNWPQHHRPATFLPTDFELEHEDDGAVTAWFSDHDPFARMKGMHGIRLRPGSSLVEARVRLFNRSEHAQTFLWWANVAAAANDDYQSFFPPDVHQIADHAKRAVASFPRVDGLYYGVDYPARKENEHHDGDRIDWYRNIPVPTSYMVTHTNADFFGGYDHGRRAGFVHWADRNIAPGKKLWTWGNAPFGWAWDANLTDTDGPYVELMAGVYTDNQPDFSWLAPGETKAFSQYWYPIREIGPAIEATRQAALSLRVEAQGADSRAVVGIAVTEDLRAVVVQIFGANEQLLSSETRDLTVREPLVITMVLGGVHHASELSVSLIAGGSEILSFRPVGNLDEPIETATEPPLPADVTSQDELFFIGQYLAQYRHASRMPEPYWAEALDRDPGDVRCNIAMAGRLAWAGRNAKAEILLKRAISRLTGRVSNPAEGEAHYQLGLILTREHQDEEAQQLFEKASWSAAWRVPSLLALARLHARAGRLVDSRSALERLLEFDVHHLQARDLLATVLRQLGRADESAVIVAETLRVDRLDQWARDLAGQGLTQDAPTLLDVALEYESAGFFDDALRLLGAAAHAAQSTASGQVNVASLAQYRRAAILEALERAAEAEHALDAARAADSTGAAVTRIADIPVLESVLERCPNDELAAVLLGNWYYDRRRPEEAIAAWERAIASGRSNLNVGIAARNLGIAAYNVHRDLDAAQRFFAVARFISPLSAKLLHETDQLAGRIGESNESRLQILEDNRILVDERDDLTVSFVNLLTQVGRETEAASILSARLFQPWEGGEGLVLAAWENAQFRISDSALQSGDFEGALAAARDAIATPATLGEARHPLASTAQLQLRLGDALAVSGAHAQATTAWEEASRFTGDFLGMSTSSFSEHTVYAIHALRRLGRVHDADGLAHEFAVWVDELAGSEASIDFFATSLPTMLLFVDAAHVAKRDRVVGLRLLLSELTT